MSATEDGKDVKEVSEGASGDATNLGGEGATVSSRSAPAASGFRVSQIDHVHVYVSDRRAAVRWYADVLGLEALNEIEGEDDGGPLILSSDGGGTSLALFRRKPDAAAARTPTTVAFRVGGAGFLDFLSRLTSLKVEGENGRALSASDVVDHDYCYSLYFKDPDGNPYELTTYDYGDVRARLGRDA